MAAIATRYWIATVSKNHVLIGRDGGFCQACHGKKAPLARMQPGDWLIYYSPKEAMEGKDPYQKFTAIGQIADAQIYQFDMGRGFVPFRRNVKYLKGTKELPIHPLLNQLSFTKDKEKSWGMAFRSGMLEIKKEDFDLIHGGMVGPSEAGKKHKPDEEKKSSLLKALDTKRAKTK